MLLANLLRNQSVAEEPRQRQAGRAETMLPSTCGQRLGATMRAVWYDRQGKADEVLVCGELPTPEAGHGEVRVRLEASGVNPSDTYRRRGPPAMEYPRVVTNSDGAGGPAHG
jgi:hypothetical protein